MSAELDELYLRWLYGQISPLSVKNPADTYWAFAKQLYQKEFVWLVSNDDNRIADGRDLRQYFIDDYHVDFEDSEWMNMSCSMLEMMVGLSRRFGWMAGLEPRDSFWIFITNLDLFGVSDLDYNRDPDLVHKVDQILDQIIWRTYEYDGSGGIFPLMRPHQDQRRTELWYQMAAYILEHEEGG